ncbi:MAG: T9SS type A sorting domain-containing protein [Chitinophagales bacterium]|nr:T9SS type A sorting domain-containing protein [Bacteroidota bacterium]MBP7400038.1 T9SS type A sorting domain-containing protein [Chitinophagales bacterium]MBP8755056.1 T9SS type A sorting domain-containing protein [Chitinophagales bacterium]MBP9190764.1 T9SS type A sorting domain-containing protein [Chitinophagales bacterium]MBP9549760.1 T9SS type A sorting domain-containing protein [Chitinophagales bacterium]
MKHFTLFIILCFYSVFISAQIVGTNAFMKGNYVQAGISSSGCFVTDSLPPAGYEVTGLTGLGFIADPDGDGWDVGTPNYCGDYSNAGAPVESWGVQINEVSYFNDLYTSYFDISGALTSYTAAGDSIIVIWQGSIAGVDIIQRTVLYSNNFFITTEVTFINLSGADINNIYYVRNIDPDNEILSTGSYVTINSIDSLPYPGDLDAVVTAVGTTYGCYLGLAARHPNARGSFGTFLIGYNGTLSNAYYGIEPYTSSGTTIMDFGIQLSFYIPFLANDEQTTVAFAYVFREEDLEDALAFYNPVYDCTGVPEVFPAESTASTTCASEEFTVSVTPLVAEVVGNIYQWQRSTDGVVFTNISGASSISYTTTQTEATWYRCKVKCTISSESTISEPVFVDTICYGCMDPLALNYNPEANSDNGSCAYPCLEIDWDNTIGGGDDDYFSAIQQTTDGGYIIGGYSQSGISYDKTEISRGGYDYWVLKLDNSGSIEWQKTIGGSGDDILVSFHQTTDGGYILGGNSNSEISGDKTEASQSSFRADYWVVKLDSVGNIEWQNTIGGNLYDYLSSVQQTADGGYIIGGKSSSDISGDKTEPNQGDWNTYDYWVVKLDSIGNIEWQNTIGGNAYDNVGITSQTTDGGYIVGGESGSGISGDKTEENIGNVDFWIVKLDESGIIEWQKTIGGTSSEVLTSIQPTSDNGYIIGGSSWSDISGDKSENSLGDNDYWVVKLNSSGTIEWDNTIGGSASDFQPTVQQSSDGGYFVGGQTYSLISGDKTEDSYFKDYWVIKLKSDGSVICQNTIGGSSNDHLYAIYPTYDGGVILGGHSESHSSGDKSEDNNVYHDNDFWIVKLGCSSYNTYYADADADGYGGMSDSLTGGCNTPPGYSLLSGDCDDADNTIHPDATEICDGLDNDCDGDIDEDVVETISISADGPTTFCQGDNVELTATYSGTSIQWKKNGSNIPGATSATLSVNSKGYYSCITTSACGTAISDTIQVIIKKNPNAFITAGGSTSFCAGDSVTLSVAPVAGSTYQWLKGGIIAGATSTTYVATTSGNYKCQVTKTSTGCFKNSNVITVSIVCREANIEAENTFTLYPNPAKDIITIETNYSTEKTFYITDALGKLIQTIHTSENTITIELNHYSSGIYFIKMDDGYNSVTQKFVKE